MRTKLALPFFCLASALLTLVSSPFARAQERILRIRLSADPSTLDWNVAHSSHETPILTNIMEGLVEEGADLNAHPALAQKWEISPDGKTYTFFLREGVLWSDGKPLRAMDFVASWLRLLDPKTASPYASFLFDIENAENFHIGTLKDRSKVGVKALDEKKFQVNLRRPVPYFIHLPSFWVTYPIRADLVSRQGSHWTDLSKLVTLGAWTLKTWERGKKIVLIRNPKYYALPAFKDNAPTRIDAIIEPDEKKARALFFETGGTDILSNPVTEDLVRANTGKLPQGARVAQFPYLATYYFALNTQIPPLNSLPIRRAILLVLAPERARIPAELQGGQTAAGGWLPPGIPGHRSQGGIEGTVFEARKLMTNAGYREGRGFPKLRILIEGFEGAEPLAHLIRSTLKEKLGIEAEGAVPSSTDFQAALKSGTAPAIINHWGADFADPANFFDVFVSRSGTNYSRMKSEAYDKLVDSALKSKDMESRLNAYREAERILVDQEAVMLPLFYKRNSVILARGIAALEITPLNYLFFKNVQMTPAAK